jgi:hypothetical protein
LEIPSTPTPIAAAIPSTTTTAGASGSIGQTVRTRLGGALGAFGLTIDAVNDEVTSAPADVPGEGGAAGEAAGGRAFCPNVTPGILSPLAQQSCMWRTVASPPHFRGSGVAPNGERHDESPLRYRSWDLRSCCLRGAGMRSSLPRLNPHMGSTPNKPLRKRTTAAVTLVIYGWYESQPGTLAWVFPSLAAALRAVSAMRNAVRWLIVKGRRVADSEMEIDIDAIRAAGGVLVERAV